MKTLQLITVLSMAVTVCPSCLGAEIVLREQVAQQGTLIRLGDIADIGASSTAELDALSRTPLLPAPAQGTQQFLTVAQVRDLLLARGVSLGEHTLAGAAIVEIGGTVGEEVNATKPVSKEIPASDLSESDLERLAQQTIVRAVQSKAGRDGWRVELTLSAGQLSKLKELGSDLVAIGPTQIRSGKQRFLLSSSAGGKELTVFATLTQIQSVVVARNRVDRGQIVRAIDVEIQQREGNLPNDTLTALEQVVGKVAQRTLVAEGIVQSTQLRDPWQVVRGETVNVFVRTGGIVVRTRAVAKENGALGDLITVEKLNDKQRLHVSVTGPSEVSIHATGGTASEYATLQRNKYRR